MAQAAPRTETTDERLKDLFAKLSPKAPEEINQLVPLVTGIVERNVAVLGEDEVFKLEDSHGEIRAFRQRVTLCASDGTLVQPVPYGPFVVSAQGYERWEEAAGAVTMKPPQVLVDGEMVQNPHIVRVNGKISEIHCRTIAFRFTPKGIPQVSDWTTILDVPAYRQIDLLAKTRKFPQAFKLLPVGMTPEIAPFTDKAGEKGTLVEVKDPTWACYPMDEATNLWVCTSHPEALQWYAQIINREKKALDFAQTFSKRNALKHLSGIQKVPGQEKPGGGIQPVNVWNLTVTSWRPTNGSILKWDSSRYARMAKALMSAAEGDTDALLINGKELMTEDPGLETEVENEEQSAGETLAGESKTGNEVPAEYPPAEEDPLFGEAPSEEKADEKKAPAPEPEKDPIAVQLETIRQRQPEIYALAQKETGIAHPMTPDGRMRMYKKILEISQRGPQKKK